MMHSLYSKTIFPSFCFLNMKNLEIIYDDDDIIIVNKPADLLTIPDRFAADKLSVSKLLTAQFGKIFILHRLDRETSGILVFAKNEHAHRNISMQFDHKEGVEKVYYALLNGVLHQESGEIDKPIGENPAVPGKMMITSQLGKPSLTLYRVAERFKNYTLVEADIRTGRTHQIRVHFQCIGYPLAADRLYGTRPELFLSDIKKRGFRLSKETEELPIMARTTLHAFRLSFTHPTTGEKVSFEAPPPKDFTALLKQLRKWGV